MTQSTMRETLSQHYREIRTRLGDRRTPPRPIIPRERFDAPPQAAPDGPPATATDAPLRLVPIAPPPPKPSRPEVVRRLEPPVEVPTLKPNARRYVLILHALAERHGVTVEAIMGRSQRPPIVAIRQEACYLLRQAGYSFPQIGRFLGNRDHTTVMHGAQRHAQRIATKGENT